MLLVLFLAVYSIKHFVMQFIRPPANSEGNWNGSLAGVL